MQWRIDLVDDIGEFGWRTSRVPSFAHSLKSPPLVKTREIRQIPLVTIFIQTDSEMLSNVPFSSLHASLDISDMYV